MKKVIFIIPFFVLESCVEPFEAETELFENVLVVEAFLTDEVKNHVVRLSRARPFEEEASNGELGAVVKVIDDLGNAYDFSEVENGRYISTLEFGASQNSSYHLVVQTSDGHSYSSEKVFTPMPTKIDDLYAVRIVNDRDEDGLSIKVNTNSSIDEIGYYRYEYDETYKIIAPFWNPFDFDVIDDLWFAAEQNDFDGFEVGIKLKEQEERVCYATKVSTQIIQTSTANLDENEVSNFEVRFINGRNAIISSRYSILMKQYRQTADAFSYYQNLQNFSSSESIFSEIQPGLLVGNMSSDTDSSVKVLGYFEVATTDKERLFVNYSDVFPNEPLPPYFINCEPVGQPLLYVPSASGAKSPLIDAIRNGSIKYHATNEDYNQNDIQTVINGEGGPFFSKARPCGDCTVLGTNTIPDFWIE